MIARIVKGEIGSDAKVAVVRYPVVVVVVVAELFVDEAAAEDADMADADGGGGGGGMTCVEVTTRELMRACDVLGALAAPPATCRYAQAFPRVQVPVINRLQISAEEAGTATDASAPS